MEARLLLAEDDPRERSALARALGRQGFEVDLAPDAAAALAALRADEHDLVLLGPLSAEPDGLELCRRLRAAGRRVPIVMLSDGGGPADRCAGLDAGADDCVERPVSTPELVARVRALLRRTRTRQAVRVRRYADVWLDADTREARRGPRALVLTRREYDLLALFLDNAECVVPRERVLAEVWGVDGGGDTNALDVYVGYLRRKLEDGGEPRLIHTVRGVGFVLRRAPGEG